MNREDLYELAVRKVLDLCDEAEEVGEQVAPDDIRKAVREALVDEQ